MSRLPLTRLIYAMMVEAAEAGAPCPTNPDIAAKFGCSKDSVKNTLRRLRDSGALRLTGRDPLRRATVVATGARTAALPPRRLPPPLACREDGRLYCPDDFPVDFSAHNLRFRSGAPA